MERNGIRKNSLVMKTYIWTCDKLVNQTMQMVDYFFPKYWPEANIIVLGYKPPTYKSKFAKFDSMGIDEGPEAICEQLHKYFSKIEDDYFMIGVDDQPLISRVNQKLINVIESIFKLNNDVGRCSITLCNSKRANTTIETIELDSQPVRIFENVEGTEYKLSIVYSMWNKKYFLKHLQGYTTIWDWEINASKAAVNDGWKVIGTEPAPLDYTHLFKHGGLRQDWYYSTEKPTPKYLTLEEQKILKKIYKI